MRRGKFQINILLVTLFAVGILSGCESLTKSLLKNPEVTVMNVKVTDINLAEISLAVMMNIKNPNPVALHLNKVTYELNVAGENVTEGVLNEGLQVPASGQNDLTLPLKFKLNSVGNILQGLLQSSFTKEYELKGTVQLGIFSIPFSKKGEVNFSK